MIIEHHYLVTVPDSYTPITTWIEWFEYQLQHLPRFRHINDGMACWKVELEVIE